MRVLAAATAILLSACAGNQSAFPVPPAFSPVEDAPLTIGHPGYVAPEPERSPHKRVLPETPATRRETGLWAVDDGPGIEVVPTIAGIPLPLPSGLLRVPEGHPVDVCGTSASRALTPDPIHDRVASLSYAERTCLAALLYDACASARARRAVQPPASIQWRDTAAEAARFVQRACDKDSRPSAVDSLVTLLLREVTR